MRAMRIDGGRRAVLASACLFLAMLALPATVVAHAELESTTPTADSTVDGPVTVVSATFDDELVAGKSSIVVLDASGASVATGGPDPGDAKTLAVTVLGLAAGAYEVRWAAATNDGHLERGRFDFTVAEPPSPAPTSAPTASAEPAVSATPAAPSASVAPSAGLAPSPAPDGSSGGSESLGQIAIIAVVGVAIGLGIGWWRSRRAA